MCTSNLFILLLKQIRLISFSKTFHITFIKLLKDNFGEMDTEQLTYNG